MLTAEPINLDDYPEGMKNGNISIEEINQRIGEIISSKNMDEIFYFKDSSQEHMIRIYFQKSFNLKTISLTIQNASSLKIDIGLVDPDTKTAILSETAWTQ